MKITEDIIKAMQRGIDSVGSISDFAQKANINIELISNFLSRSNPQIGDDIWKKLYPLIQPHLKKEESKSSFTPVMEKNSKDVTSLSSDEKILLDAFSALSREVQSRKLLEIVNLAKEEVEKSKKG